MCNSQKPNRSGRYFLSYRQLSTSSAKQGLTIEEKQQINDQIISNIGTKFRVEFVDCLNAINPSLYESIMAEYDTLVDSITNHIFDEGINLSHKPKFDELITSNIFKAKTEMLKLLFGYDGA